MAEAVVMLPLVKSCRPLKRWACRSAVVVTMFAAAGICATSASAATATTLTNAGRIASAQGGPFVSDQPFRFHSYGQIIVAPPGATQLTDFSFWVGLLQNPATFGPGDTM